MSFTYQLTDHAQKRITERAIPLEWIERTLFNPQKKIEPDKIDPELSHAFATISEFGDRVLRVVYNHRESPWEVITIHFDRKMKGKL